MVLHFNHSFWLSFSITFLNCPASNCPGRALVRFQEVVNLRPLPDCWIWLCRAFSHRAHGCLAGVNHVIMTECLEHGGQCKQLCPGDEYVRVKEHSHLGCFFFNVHCLRSHAVGHHTLVLNELLHCVSVPHHWDLWFRCSSFFPPLYCYLIHLNALFVHKKKIRQNTNQIH